MKPERKPDNLTEEERREIEELRAQALSSMKDEDFRRFVDLVRKERGDDED